MKKRKFPLNLMTAAQILFILLLLSGWAAGQDYTLQYSQFGIAGGVSQTTDYQVVDLITDLGTSGEIQSSGDYTVTPTIGSGDVTTSAIYWMLYE